VLHDPAAALAPVKTVQSLFAEQPPHVVSAVAEAVQPGLVGSQAKSPAEQENAHVPALQAIGVVAVAVVSTPGRAEQLFVHEPQAPTLEVAASQPFAGLLSQSLNPARQVS